MVSPVPAAVDLVQPLDHPPRFHDEVAFILAVEFDLGSFTKPFSDFGTASQLPSLFIPPSFFGLAGFGFGLEAMEQGELVVGNESSPVEDVDVVDRRELAFLETASNRCGFGLVASPLFRLPRLFLLTPGRLDQVFSRLLEGLALANEGLGPVEVCWQVVLEGPETPESLPQPVRAESAPDFVVPYLLLDGLEIVKVACCCWPIIRF